jgi:class 3 adenylate cyclase/tetratricopeptide (TPR) repeat protein/tRNA A-37 threonylcarbamoyl transferase component Bud32
MKTQTLGPYELLEEIGYGGMATVYRAHQPSVERDVAIKVILRARLDDPEAVQRFQREARLVARLEHPHILPVYDFDGRHDPPYIVMRYLDSGTLREVMGKGALPLNEASFLIQQIGSALDYAHRQGIVHRDIKPSNILIDRDGNAFVTDFGIARMVSGGQHITMTGALMGTPAYMSPEQAQGQSDLDHRTDIYALGVILYQMLTGELPYAHDNNFSVMMMHVNDPIPSAYQKKPDLPPTIDNVIRRVLAKKPDERYQSAMEMAQALAMVVGSTISAPPTRLRLLMEDAAVTHATSPTTGSTRTPSEQNKTITTLYASAAEYAELVDEISGAEAARKALRTWWTAAEEAITDYGGRIFTRAEDTIMALWGAEMAREDDAERAIRAALTMRETMRQQAATYLDGDDELLPLNIAINTGLVLLTPHEDSGDLTASGTTISTTNRLMQQAEGLILITHNTYTQVRGVFEMEPDEPLALRRSRSTVPTYRVNSAKPRAFRRSTRGVEGVETRLIGRDGELKVLQNAFLDALEDRETQVVTIVSEAGLGKSRLLYEFVNWSDLRPEIFWVLRGRATPEMTNRPYALLRDLISFRYQIQDNDSPAVARRKLEEGLRQQIGENEEMAHLLGHLVGFDFSASPHVKGLLSDPKQLTERARQTFFRWIQALCGRNPAVFEVEDVHLADDASLDLLMDLVTQFEALPLLLICVARPSLYERRPSWGSGQPAHTRLELRPLDRRESRNLAREILQKVPDIPRALRDLIVERGEGNPFYMEELVKMLIDDRVIIKQSEDVWLVEEERLGHLEVPATLVGLLQARLDSLLYPEKLTLQRAAVIGRIFYDTALEALDTADDTHVDDLPGILDRLVAQEFIHERETTAFAGSTEYIFGKTMLQDVLESTLLRRQQERYNRAAAEWLVEISGARVAEYNGLIAEYYEKGGAFEQAAYYLQNAGEQALRISAFGNARALFERALTLLPAESKTRLVLFLRLGEARYFLSDYPAARKSLESAIKMARGFEDGAHTADALYWLSQTAVMQGDYPQAQSYLEESLPLARSGNDAETLSRVLYGLGDLLWRQGHADEAVQLLDECLALSRKVGNVTQELYAMNRLGGIVIGSGDWEKASSIYEAILIKARQTGNRERESSALNNLGVVAYERGDWQATLNYANQALPLAREVGNQQFIALLLNNLADVSLRLDDFTAAQQYLFEGITVARQIGSAPYVLTVVQTAGLMLARQGELERGLALIGLSLYHPTSTPEHRRTAQDCLRTLGLAGEDTAVQSMLAKGKSLDLDTVAEELLAAWGSKQ